MSAPTASAIPKQAVQQLHPELGARLNSIRSARAFDPQTWIDTRTVELLTYLQTYNLKSCIVSVSGGVDSSCIAGLLKYAQKKASLLETHPFSPKNGGKIVCVAQPFHSTADVQNRAYEMGRAFGLEIITVDRTPEYDSSMAKVENAIGTQLLPFAKAMCKSYERTPINYLLASNFGGVVVGTGNKDEDGYLYYYCKFGDGAVDIGLIWDLHKSQVFEVAAALGVPNSILLAPPTADLAPGQTDEEEIGATYDMVELVTTYVIMSPEDKIALTNGLSAEAFEQFHREFLLIEAIHRKGSHKADLNPKNIGSTWYQTNVVGATAASLGKPQDAAATAAGACDSGACAAGGGEGNGNGADTPVTLTTAQVTSIVAYIKWPQHRQQQFLQHFESDDEARRDFVRKVDFVRAVREL